MLICKQHEGTNYGREWNMDAGPMYVDLKIRNGQEFAAQVATHLAAMQFAAGASFVSTKTLRKQVHEILAAICEMNIADGTIHYNDETKVVPSGAVGR